MEAGQGYFSTVTYNREHGQGVGPPTIRYVQPVLNEVGALFGAIVVNADFQALITAARPSLSDGLRLTVVTDAGDHMTFSVKDQAPQLFFHADADFINPPHDVKAASTAGPAQISFDGDTVIAAGAVVTPHLDRPFGLYVVTKTPRQALFAAANRMLVWNVAVATILILLAIGLAVLIGSRLTEPLRCLAMAVRGHHGSAT